MGLGNSSQMTFVNVSNGKCVIKENGEKKEYGHLSGSLYDLSIDTDTYENKSFKVLSLFVEDKGERYRFKVRLESAYCRAFCMAIPNADLAQPITLIPSCKMENGKEKRTLFISQNGKGLKHFWTKDNPGELPGLVKVTFKGQDQWDNTQQVEFLTSYLLNVLKPKLQPPPPAILDGPASDMNKGAAVTRGGKVIDANDITEPIDDLPF